MYLVAHVGPLVPRLAYQPGQAVHLRFLHPLPRDLGDGDPEDPPARSRAADRSVA